MGLFKNNGNYYCIVDGSLILTGSVRRFNFQIIALKIVFFYALIRFSLILAFMMGLKEFQLFQIIFIQLISFF